MNGYQGTGYHAAALFCLSHRNVFLAWRRLKKPSPCLVFLGVF
jgi:hypothetical protein